MIDDIKERSFYLFYAFRLRREVRFRDKTGRSAFAEGKEKKAKLEK